MDEPKYKIGQKISFRSSLRGQSSSPGQYRIVGYRPPQEGEQSYRIKSDLERHERIARESELR